MPNAARILALSALLALAAPTLEAAPAQLHWGPGFEGQGQELEVGPWPRSRLWMGEENHGSLRVSPGYRVTLWEGQFSGRSLVATGDLASFGELEGKVSSLLVESLEPELPPGTEPEVPVEPGVTARELNERALGLWRAGRRVEAARTWEQAVGFPPGASAPEEIDAEPWNNLGFAHFEIGRRALGPEAAAHLQRARQVLEVVVDRAPSRWQARLNLADTCVELTLHECALEQDAAFLKLNPTHARAAAVRERRQHFEAALAEAPVAVLRSRVHPDLPPYTLELYSESGSIQRIAYHSSGDLDRHWEFVTASARAYGHRDGPGCRLVDVDFDGYEDLECSGMTGNVNTVHDYYLFDPAAGRFAHQPAFSSSNALALFPESRELGSWARNSCCSHTTYRHVVVDGKLVTVKKVTTGEGESGEDVVVQELRDGQLVETWRGHQSEYDKLSGR